MSVIPLEEQLRIFDEEAEDARAKLILMLHDDEWAGSVIALGRKRIQTNFPRFKDAMYRWTARWRGVNVEEEIADAIAYLTSGPVDGC
jgi:hypothetical protein